MTDVSYSNLQDRFRRFKILHIPSGYFFSVVIDGRDNKIIGRYIGSNQYGDQFATNVFSLDEANQSIQIVKEALANGEVVPIFSPGINFEKLYSTDELELVEL